MSAANVLKFIKEKEAEFVDLRFTDPRGKLQHLTMDASIVDEEMLNEGVFFDGSSIAGWKAILFLFILFALVKAIVPRYRYDQKIHLHSTYLHQLLKHPLLSVEVFPLDQ